MARLFGGSILALIAAAAQAQAGEPLFAITETDPDRADEATREAFGRAFPAGATRSIDGKSYAFAPIALIELGGGLYALVSLGTNANNCHACAGINAVHYLRDAEGGYQLVGEWLDVGAAGSFGSTATRWGVSRALAEPPVLYTEGGGTWQGYTCSWASLTALRPNGPRELVETIPVYYGAPDGEAEIRGAITEAAPGGGFTVSYSGSHAFSEPGPPPATATASPRARPR